MKRIWAQTTHYFFLQKMFLHCKNKKLHNLQIVDVLFRSTNSSNKLGHEVKTKQRKPDQFITDSTSPPTTMSTTGRTTRTTSGPDSTSPVRPQELRWSHTHHCDFNRSSSGNFPLSNHRRSKNADPQLPSTVMTVTMNNRIPPPMPCSPENARKRHHRTTVPLHPFLLKVTTNQPSCRSSIELSPAQCFRYDHRLVFDFILCCYEGVMFCCYCRLRRRMDKRKTYVKF